MRARRALVALPLVLAPGLQIASASTHPHLHGEILDVVATDPQTWHVIHLFAAVAAMGYLVGLPALAALPRRKGALLAALGTVVAVAGSLCLAIGFVAEAHMLPLLAQSDLDREAALALTRAEDASIPFRLIGLGLPLAGIGQLLLAIGLLRSGVVAWWKPALVVVGLLTSLAVPPGQVLAAVLMGLFAVGYAALAVDVVRGPRPERVVGPAADADRPAEATEPVPA